jgi:hypothetical protein
MPIMKKFFTIVFCIGLLSACTISAKAQYLTGIGASLGMYGRGATILQYFNPVSRGAGDFLITSQYKGFVFTGLYEIHNPNHNERIELANVGFFGGIGGHGGSVLRTQYGNNKNPTVPGSKERIFVAGFDAIIGAEWKLPHVPLLLSVNFKPYIDINYFKYMPDYFDAAITLRLLF